MRRTIYTPTLTVSINHRAIIQVYDFQAGKYILENHYTTCGTFHLPMDAYETDKKYFKIEYSDSRAFRPNAEACAMISHKL